MDTTLVQLRKQVYFSIKIKYLLLLDWNDDVELSEAEEIVEFLVDNFEEDEDSEN